MNHPTAIDRPAPPLQPLAAWLLTVCAAIVATSIVVLSTGCAAGVDVRNVGTAPGEPPAFDLRGGNLAALDAQTRQLCPNGHQVLRQWQRLHRQALSPGTVATWVSQHGRVQDAVSGVLDDGEAQLTVQCQPAAAPAVVAAASAASATSTAAALAP